MTPTRRDVLALVAATATAAATGTAGAQATDDLPAYSRWLALEDGGLEFVYADWATLEEFVLEDLEELEPGEAELPAEFENDPMVAPVSDGLLWAFFFVGVDLARFRLGRLLDDDDAFASTVEELIRANEAFVVSGAIDRGEIDARLTAEPEAEFIVQLEATDEIDGYTVYTPVDGDVSAAIAVDDEALVVVDEPDDETDADPQTILEATVDAASGETERATDDEDLAWLLETAGAGDVAVGQYGVRVGAEGVVDVTFPELEGADGVVTSLSMVDEETSDGTFAALVDDPDEAALEAALGASGEDQSVDVDGERVTATATWQEDVTIQQ